MISAWTIYWVMQMDNIASMFLVAAVVGGVAAILLWCIYNDAASSCPEEWGSSDYRAKYQRKLDMAPALFKRARQITVLAALLFIVAYLLPSTKTAAAMLVIPAVANNETVQKEAGELYGIAKDALHELAKPDLPTAKQAAEEPE